ncbi:MAG: hypothetical protein KA250_09290 [Verrucomicrobiales bacterium]|jgi:hypothetical protein|nr:hypothetical protein [Verrucomicrobiales bacterium]MBP9226125.1 hypothetical protein [Verrucomicrobiales bacterium]HQZ27623.1 c-type cytochrome [Verrucomicrobiales bacterium]
MKKILLLLSITFLAISLAPRFSNLLAADPAKKGFQFPGGDLEAGKETFVSLNCIQCHTVSNVALPEGKAPRRLELMLAGETRFVKSYGDLITAITNPKHVITEQYRAILSGAELQGSIEPLMPDYTKDMSVRQLMDLVAFLDQAYRENLSGYGGE